MLIYTRHDPRFFDRRLYAGGGGDNGVSQMQQQEQDRQSKVQAAVDAINGKFGIGTDKSAQPAPTAQQFAPQPGSSGYGFGPAGVANAVTRAQNGLTQANADYVAGGGPTGATPIADAAKARQAMYQSVADATTQQAERGLDQQFTQAGRQNTYGLADSGLLGGSADAESNGDLQTRYGQGRMQATALGTKAAADLQSSDEQTRQRLIQLAQSGLDTGTAANLASGQMSAAANLASTQAQTATVGNLFGDMGQAYLTNRTLAARYPNGLPMSNTMGTGNNYSSSGITGNYSGTAG